LGIIPKQNSFLSFPEKPLLTGSKALEEMPWKNSLSEVGFILPAVRQALGLPLEVSFLGVCSMSTTATVSDASKLLDVRGVAELLNCSPRHVYRLADSGRMPAPVKLGSLVRWNKASIDEWIATGCKPVRAGKGVRV